MSPHRLPATFRRSAIAVATCTLWLLPAIGSQAAEPGPVGAEFQVNTMNADRQRNPAIAVDADGDFVVAWRSYDGTGFGSYSYSYEIVARRYSAAGVALGGDFQINAVTMGGQSDPVIGLDADGDFVVAWKGRDGLGDGIIARRYNAAGLALGDEFQVNTVTPGRQDNPTIAVDADGDFVVAWQSDASGSYEIVARRYDAAGVASGGEFQVNAVARSEPSNPAIAADADGDFVVAWASRATSYDIAARRYQGPDAVDVTLTQTDAADPAAVGAPLAYTFDASNLRAPVTATGIAAIDRAIGSATGLRVTDTLPAGSTAVSGSGINWSCPAATVAGKLTCDYALPLRAGQHASPLSVSLTPSADPGALIKNVGMARANQVDDNPDNNRSIETTRVVPSVRFDFARASQNEATASTVRVQLSAAYAQTVTVPYTRAGAATFTTDYTLSLPSPITFNPGEIEKLIVITPMDDAIDEPNENARLTLGTPTNATLGAVTIHTRTIVDNDP